MPPMPHGLPSMPSLSIPGKRWRSLERLAHSAAMSSNSPKPTASIADASRSDQTLVRSLGADYVLDRGDTFAGRVRSIVSEGVPGLADGAMLNSRALPAIADGGALAVIRG